MFTGNSITKIIVKLLIIYIIYSFLFIKLPFVSHVQAVVVTNIEIIPSQPVFDQQFECILSVDIDESNLACDLLKVEDPDTNKPIDICPKRDSLGHRYTQDNKRHYNCLIGPSTGITNPGRYRIVAWRFYDDGAYGDVIASKTINVVNVPPPTLTLVPTKKAKPSPTQKIIVPSKNPIPTPTKKYYNIVPPNNVIPSDRKEVVPPGNQFFPKGQDSFNKSNLSDKDYPLFTRFPSLAFLKNIPTQFEKGKDIVIAVSQKSFIETENIIKTIIYNFLKETAF